ncbi:unnamed protein product, partial [Closterium sp. NIES-54]
LLPVDGDRERGSSCGRGTGPMQAELSFPGSALSFVPIACYCYGRPCRLSPHSVLLVRSAGAEVKTGSQGWMDEISSLKRTAAPRPVACE